MQKEASKVLQLVKEAVSGDVDFWLTRAAEGTLSGLGVRRGQTVLDFGSGPGYYAVPAARIVGRSGRVFAVETNPVAVLRARWRTMRADLPNVAVLGSRGITGLPLGDDSVDLTLAFDVLLPYYFSDPEISQVLGEISRVSRPEAVLAVYPSHVPAERLLPLIVAAGFQLGARMRTRLLHDGRLMRDEVLVFGKTPS